METANIVGRRSEARKRNARRDELAHRVADWRLTSARSGAELAVAVAAAKAVAAAAAAAAEVDAFARSPLARLLRPATPLQSVVVSGACQPLPSRQTPSNRPMTAQRPPLRPTIPPYPS